MNILYISQSIIPSKSANSVHVMKICSAFAKLKNRVDLFAQYSKDMDDMGDIKDVHKFYSVEKNFNILKIKNLKNRLLNEIKTTFFIFYYIIKKKYELIFSRSIHVSWFLSLLGIKTILEIHSPPSKKTNFFFKSLLRNNKINHLITINSALLKYIKENYQIHQNLKIFVIPDASDSFNKSKPILNDFKIKKNSIGYLGHLYEGRGINLIFKLAKYFPSNNFYIVGGTNVHLNFWKNKAKLNNIFFLGFQNQENCNYLRNKFDYLIAPYENKVFVHGSPTRKNKLGSTLETSRWMSPLKIFEYMSVKKPIISSDLNSIREILVNNHNAILCNPNKFSEWKLAIKKLNTDKIFRDKIAKNALNTFQKNFTWDIRVRNIINNFKNIKNITIFNFSLSGGGTEYMLSGLFNKLNLNKKYNTNFLICQGNGSYIEKINNKKKLFILNKERVFFSLFAIIKFLKKTETNILFTSMTHTNLAAIFIKLFFCPSLKLIIRESNTISYKFSYEGSIKSKILYSLVKIFYNYADVIISPTTVIKNDLIKNFKVKKNKIKVISNPYDFVEIKKLTEIKPSKDDIRLINKPFILNIGRLHPQKNLKFLINVFQKIVEKEKFKNLSLYILGEGKLKEELNNIIKSKNLSSKIKLLGFKKNPFIFMQKCKLFFLSSIYEGHSNVLVHSQILNRKILSSSAHGANDEVLNNNGNIYNSSIPANVANLACKIIKNKKTDISYEYLKNKFEDNKVVSKIENLF